MATRDSKPIRREAAKPSDDLKEKMERNKAELNDAVSKLTRNVAEQVGQGEPESTPERHEPTETQPLQMKLEFWPDHVRGMPNAALRGSLFSVAKIRTIAKKRELLSSVENIEIRFKGERFNQTDLDVVEMLLHYNRGRQIDATIEFSVNKLLHDLDRATGGGDHEQLKEELARLMGGVVEITWKKEKRTFSGSFIRNAYRDDKTQTYVVVLDEKMIALFEQGFTWVDWEQRRALGTNNLAKWLHGFYSTHSDPYAYKVETLKELCGSTTGRLGDFRKALHVALDKLKAVGAITDASRVTENDSVEIVRRRHRPPKLDGKK